MCVQRQGGVLASPQRTFNRVRLRQLRTIFHQCRWETVPFLLPGEAHVDVGGGEVVDVELYRHCFSDSFCALSLYPSRSWGSGAMRGWGMETYPKDPS